MKWTPDMDDILRQFHARGIAAAVTAKRIGVTRNAVIGRAHRLGLSSPRQPSVKLPKASITAISAGRKSPATKPTKKPFEWMKAEPLPPEPEPPAQLVALVDLEPHHCRFPHGDPKQEGFGFCGSQVVEGLSYCASHARKVFVVSNPHRPNFTGDLRARINGRTKVIA